MNKFVSIAFLIAGMSISICSQAQERVTVEKNGSTFFVHQVEQGQTLYAISKLYQVEVSAIEKANPSVTSGLQIGQTLDIPVPGSYNENEWTNPIRIEKGFYIHRIKRKETLYGISKQYQTDINEILELNSGIELGLQPGLEIKLPIREADEPVSKLAEPGPMDGWQIHTVKQGETLYGISKFYNVTSESISDLNDGLPEGLKAGQNLKLPIRDELFSKQTDPIDLTLEIKDTLYLKDTYNVVFMLPLYLSEPIEEEFNTSGKIGRLRQIALEYYYGSLIALDSLKAHGAKLNVTVLDVTSDSSIENILQKNVVKHAHLIVGPFQREPLEKVASFAGRKGIHVVCPVPQSNKVLLRSPNLSKVYPSSDSEMKQMAKYVADNHSGENVILIDSKDVKDARSVQLFKKYYKQALGVWSDSIAAPLTVVESSSKFVGNLNSKLSKVRRNILIVPAGKQSRSMIANLQTKVQLLNPTDFDVLVFASDEWLDYEFLDVSFKERVQLAVTKANFVDYTNARSQTFVRNYQEKFRNDPSNYAFLGYDVMQFYGNGLIQFGINFPNKFELIDTSSLIQMSFNYSKTGLDSGYENTHVFVVRQNEMQLEKLNESKSILNH